MAERRKRRSGGLRYRPYGRSTSIHLADPDIICDDDDDDMDSIVVLYDGVRQATKAAADAAKATTEAGDRGAGRADQDGSAKTAAASADKETATGTEADNAAAAEQTDLPAAYKSSLDHSPWRVSRIPLPVDSLAATPAATPVATPAATPAASPAATPAAPGAGASQKMAGYLTVDEAFSPFAASPVGPLAAAGISTVKKRPLAGRRKGPVTSTPAPGASRSGSGATPPAAPLPDVSEVQDVTPFVITLDEDPSVLEVTEVRRVVRQNTPGTIRKVTMAPRTDLSADVLLLDTSADATLVAGRKESGTPGKAGIGRGVRRGGKSPGRLAKSPGQAGAKTYAAASAAPAAALESSLEEGELSRTHTSQLSRSGGDCTVVRVRPLRRTSSTQRRLQAVLRMARRTLTRSQLSPGTQDRSRARRTSRVRKSSKTKKSSKSEEEDHRRRRKMKRVDEPEKWRVDRRGNRFGAPLGATSDQPIRFAPDFSESFARMVTERPKRPIIIDGPNVAYAHGRNQTCSIRGIKITVDYFRNLGHKCTVFIPSTFINRARSEENVKLLEAMYESGELAYTPSRRIRGRLVTSYDDRYVVMYATRVGGVIVSRDLYRDVAMERPDWKDTIDNRLLIPVFVGDQLLLPPDPLGRDGPGLLEFLTFPPGTSLLPDEGPPRR